MAGENSGRDNLSVQVIEFDLDKLSEALHMPSYIVREVFRDGRVAWRFAEHWAQDGFCVTRHKSNTHISTDAFVPLHGDDRVEYAIRTLTKGGIKFQDSRYYGTGRSCNLATLKECVRRSDRWIVVDITAFPVVKSYKLKSSMLDNWIDMGDLNVNGVSYDRFFQLIRRDGKLKALQQMELI